MCGLTTVLATSAITRDAAAQYQAERVTVTRNFHDAAWVSGGLALTLTLKELGVRPTPATLIGGAGLVTAVKLMECARWCGRPEIDWPARIAIKDAFYDALLASSAAPMLIGKRKGWKAGVATGALWVGTALLMRRANWNSP